MKWLILILVVVFSMSFVLATEYTPFTKTDCIKSSCNQIVYSSTQFVQEDGVWKDYQLARSLKDKGFSAELIENDGKHIIEVIDFNATSLKVKLDVAGFVVLPYKTKIRLWDSNGSLNFKNGKKLVENDVNFNFIKQSMLLELPFTFGDVLEFGDNSTSLILNSTSNTADIFIREGYPDTDYGTPVYHIFDSGGTGEKSAVLTRWNVTSIPAGKTIDYANLHFNIYTLGMASTERINLTFFPINYSFAISEATSTWNNANANSVAVGPQSNGVWIYDAMSTGFYSWNVTSAIQEVYSLGYTNITFKSNVTYTNATGLDQFRFYSREYSTASGRPYLNISYSIPATYCPDYTSGNYVIDCSTECSMENPENLGYNNFSTTGSGIIYLQNITNINKISISSGCQLVLPKGGNLG